MFVVLQISFQYLAYQWVKYFVPNVLCTINILRLSKDTTRIIIADSRVTLQIVASLTDDSIGIIYAHLGCLWHRCHLQRLSYDDHDHNMLIIQTTGPPDKLCRASKFCSKLLRLDRSLARLLFSNLALLLLGFKFLFLNFKLRKWNIVCAYVTWLKIVVCKQNASWWHL